MHDACYLARVTLIRCDVESFSANFRGETFSLKCVAGILRSIGQTLNVLHPLESFKSQMKPNQTKPITVIPWKGLQIGRTNATICDAIFYLSNYNNWMVHVSENNAAAVTVLWTIQALLIYEATKCKHFFSCIVKWANGASRKLGRWVLKQRDRKLEI